MIRLVSIVFACFWFCPAFSQADAFDSLFSLGKAEFDKEFSERDFVVAAEHLEKAVALRPDHAEARYFLGYAYSGLNSNDGSGLIRTTLFKTNRSSVQFEKAIELEPNYSGEIVVLDPYAKISSEWGSLAIAFLDHDKPDSARWALEEGKRRGGFSNYCISFTRALLDYCTDNAILMSRGDMMTFPLLYTQLVDEYRTDVSVIDLSLLNTSWYEKILEKYFNVEFDLPKQMLDTIQYVEWKDSAITAGGFSWVVKPSYSDRYIIRGNILLLNIITANKFSRDLYFPSNTPPEDLLSLDEYLIPVVCITRVNHDGAEPISHQVYLDAIRRLLEISYLANPNIKSDMDYISMIRYDILIRISESMNNNKPADARELLNIMDLYLEEETFPVNNQSFKDYIDFSREVLNP